MTSKKYLYFKFVQYLKCNYSIIFIQNISVKFILYKIGINPIPDFGMPSVVAELYRIWYKFHTSFFAVWNRVDNIEIQSFFAHFNEHFLYYSHTY